MMEKRYNIKLTHGYILGQGLNISDLSEEDKDFICQAFKKNIVIENVNCDGETTMVDLSKYSVLQIIELK